MGDKHSKMLSPSASKRWLACPGSSQQIIDAGLKNTTSPEAERGTVQHGVAEKLFLGEITDKYCPEEVTEDEWVLVTTAVQWAEEYIDALDDPDVVVLTEVEVSLPAPHEECFGTADIVVYSPRLKLLAVLDYKFGYGVVIATGNSQLKIYGLGAANAHPEWEIEEFEGVILQPKINSEPDVFNLDAAAMREWYNDILIPKMDLVLKGGGEIIPGSHCETNYCPARGQCRAQSDESLQILDDFMAPTVTEGTSIEVKDEDIIVVDGKSFLLTDQELGQLIDKLDTMKSIVKSIEAAALERLKEDRRIKCEDGPLKLVRGKANRTWVDPDAAEKYVRGKIGAEAAYTKKFISPAQAEKKMKDELKNKTVAKNFYKHIAKGEGALTFARASDKREAVNYVDPLLEDSMDTEDIDLF